MLKLTSLKVSQTELRDKFNANAGGYPQRMTERTRVCTYNEPASAKSKQPRGSRSKIDKFYDGETLVMVVHYFRNPDGSIGGSGRYDPKRLLVGDVLYWT